MPAGPRAPATVRAVFYLGAILASWMTLDGVWGRLFGAYLFPSGWHSFWKSFPWASDAHALGWPLVAIGAGWPGALLGLSLGRRWARTAAAVLASAALAWLGVSTVLGAAVLWCLFAPSTRRWIREMEARGV